MSFTSRPINNMCLRATMFKKIKKVCNKHFMKYYPSIYKKYIYTNQTCIGKPNMASISSSTSYLF